MSFLSLYRKYRPRKFNDLVGQQHVVKTLINAIKYDRIAHAYLFAGPRGTGKTSTAKVFAMALNCQDGDSVEPCGKCTPCVNIQRGQSIDVIEIDAASNRGIDEIRELREKVKFYPGEGQYKVYIIDEVHMLTRGAFNALLKTLEEPPENVVFILATTEPHKVISTIHSRCQRFDFSLLSAGDMQKRLQYICEQENVKYEDEALSELARSANGGLRDAISLLDQAISFTDGNINITGVQEMLGKVKREVLNDFLRLIKDYNSADALKMVDEVIAEGRNVSRFINDLIEHCRQLLIIKECGLKAGIIELPEEVLQTMQKESEYFTSSRLIKFIDILTDVDREIKYSNRAQQILELAIIKMTSPGTRLKEKVAELEKKLKNIQDGSKVIEEKEEVKGVKRKVISGEKNGEVGKNPENKPENTARKSTEKEEKTDTGSGDLNIDKIRKKWPVILRKIKKEDITTHALLVEGKITSFEKDKIVIEFPPDKDFHRKNTEQKSDFINKIFNEVLSNPCQLEFCLAGGDDSKKKIKVDEKEEDIVGRIARIFDGQVIEVDHEVLKNKESEEVL